jgi:methionyl-tRNA synthetase
VPPAAPAAPAAGDERLSIEEFFKVDLRVAKIVAAEKVKGSKRLVQMQVDLGAEQRQIVAGIAEAYAAESLVGRHIVVVVNLKPAKLMGIESNGMLLAASAADGRPILVGFPDEAPPPGSKIT